MNASSDVTRTDTSSRPFVLGSSSPRRKDLLAQIGYVPDLIVGADIDETPHKNETPRAYCLRMAIEKNAALVPLYADSLIVTADTMIAVGRRIIGKPADRGEAERIVRLLSGRAHRVYSAVTVSAPNRAPVTRLSISRVTLKRLDEAEIQGFLETLDWQGVSGGYRLQGAMAQFMVTVQGSPSGIIGLPLYETAQILKGFGAVRKAYGGNSGITA